MSSTHASVEIIPAILAQSFEDMHASLSLIQGVAPVVQIDVVDGVFAPNTTWPYRDVQTFERIVSGETDMPLWDVFDFEFDLMVQHPEEVVEGYVKAGASRIVIHRASHGSTSAVALLQDVRQPSGFGVSIGVAISVQTPLEDLVSIEGQFDYLQIMGISKIGFQGQPFDTSVFEKITELRQQHPNMPIQVDGGVDMQNAAALVSAGASRLIVGSAIFGSDDPKMAYYALQECVKSA